MQCHGREKWIIRKDKDIQINLFFGDDPFALGHIVIQPRSRVDDISKLTDDHWKIFSKWVPKVSNAMKKVLKEVSGKEVQRIYLCSFNESPDYPVHFHLVPRYECETLKGPDLLFLFKLCVTSTFLPKQIFEDKVALVSGLP
jgi:diadenosine tetraphosphate (Ap4A) HIT family hydrolase